MMYSEYWVYGRRVRSGFRIEEVRKGNCFYLVRVEDGDFVFRSWFRF